MEKDDGYIVTPYSDISETKKKLKRLDNKDEVGSSELISSMKDLTKNMSGMLELFKTAADEMKLEEQEEHTVSEHINPIMQKLDEIIEQNKIIAEGMVALSELVKEKLSDAPAFKGPSGPLPTRPPAHNGPSRPVSPPPVQPPPGPAQSMAPPPAFDSMPPPGMPPSASSGQTPPPLPPQPEKKSFGFLKK